MKHFIIVVDMQRDFVAADGALCVAGAEDIVAPMRDWLANLQRDDVAGVLFTQDSHVAEIYAGSPEGAQFPPHCERGTPGWALVIDPEVIDPKIPVYVLEKSVFNMWEEPGLSMQQSGAATAVDRDRFFATLMGEVQAVTVVGVAADYCVRWAVDGVIDRGFRVTVPSTLTRGIARQIEQVAADEWTNSAVTIESGDAS